MTEFEEITFKKIIKDYLIDKVYYQINLICGRFGISNAEISKKIGWDPAVYNQKYNRSNDLRITTFMKIYVAIDEIIEEKENECHIYGLERDKVSLDELITEDSLQVCRLFNHISAAAEGQVEFLNSPQLKQIYSSLKTFVTLGKKSKKFSQKEIEAYIRYYRYCDENAMSAN